MVHQLCLGETRTVTVCRVGGRGGGNVVTDSECQETHVTNSLSLSNTHKHTQTPTQLESQVKDPHKLDSLYERKGEGGGGGDRGDHKGIEEGSFVRLVADMLSGGCVRGWMGEWVGGWVVV